MILVWFLKSFFWKKFFLEIFFEKFFVKIFFWKIFFWNFFFENFLQWNLKSASTIDTIAIVILDFIFERIAIWITEFEIPKTQEDYDNSYSLKLFSFKCINYYFSLIIIAFFKDTLAGWPGDYFYIGLDDQETSKNFNWFLNFFLNFWGIKSTVISIVTEKDAVATLLYS